MKLTDKTLVTVHSNLSLWGKDKDPVTSVAERVLAQVSGVGHRQQHK